MGSLPHMIVGQGVVLIVCVDLELSALAASDAAIVYCKLPDF